jgi:hypothetical protein
MTQEGQLAQRTRNAIKVAMRLLLVGQVLANAYLLYLHGKLGPLRTDPRVGMLLIPGFIYLMVTKVPDVLKTSDGIRRQAILLADWWLAFATWQFVAGLGNGPLIALFMIGVVIITLSVKDAIQIQA